MSRKSGVILLGLAALSTSCSAGSGNSPSPTGGNVGTGGGGANGGPPGVGGTFVTAGDAALSNALAAHIEQNHVTVSIVTLACAGGCADVVAVGSGGYEPYTFAWEDGSTNAARHVCATTETAYRVSVTDTGATSGEFPRPPATVTAALTADVLTCPPDGGTHDAGLPAVTHVDAGACAVQTLMPDIKGQPTYFSGGATLPAGKYRITYVDGCMKYDATWFWTVNAEFNDEFLLIGENTATVLGTLPGTSAPFGFGVGGYADFDACVAANRALPSLDFDFAGGKLGIWQNDFKPEDNLGGPNGDSPTWRLTRLDGCP